MLFGYAIDQACLVTQTSCTRKGACLLYEADTFRHMLHGFPIALKVGALFVFSCAFFWSRSRDRKVMRKEALAKEAVEQKEMAQLK